MGSVKKGEKYEGYYLLKVSLIGGNLTELCLCIQFSLSGNQGKALAEPWCTCIKMYYEVLKHHFPEIVN